MTGARMMKPTAAAGIVVVTLAVGAGRADLVVTFEDLAVPAIGFFDGDPGTLAPGQAVSAAWTSGGVSFSNTFGIERYGDFEYRFWSGFAYSRVIDTTDPAFTNQYASFPGGGYESDTYAVAYGGGATVTLSEPGRPSGLRIANTTYAALTMRDGDPYGFSSPLPSGGWFATTATGRRGTETTGSATFHLADLRGASPPGIVSGWSWFDLTALGIVDRIDFTFDGSDKGSFGLNTPAYFALDDLTLMSAPATDVMFDIPAGMVTTQGLQGHPVIVGPVGMVKLGGGTLVIDAVNTHTGTTIVHAGTLAVAAGAGLRSSPVTIRGGGALTLPADVRLEVEFPSLVIDHAAGGRLDVGAGRLTIAPGGTTESAIRAALVAGRGVGDFAAARGIVTSGDPAGLADAAAVGYRILEDGSALVAWAAFGDANLDGQVSQADVNLIVSGGQFGAGSSVGSAWSQGDFNYSGGVTQADVNLLVTAGLMGRGPYLPATAATLPGASAHVPVPEPATPWVAAGLALLRTVRVRRGRATRPAGPA